MASFPHHSTSRWCLPAIALICACMLCAPQPAQADPPAWLQHLKQAAQAIKAIKNAKNEPQHLGTKPIGPSNASANSGQSGSSDHASAAPVATTAGVNIQRTVLGNPPARAQMIISPAGQHVAWSGYQGSRSVMFVDGKPGPVFDAFIPNDSTALHFSADGKVYAYLARAGDQIDVVRNGKIIGHIPKGGCITKPCYRPLQFGPHGHHFYTVGRMHNRSQLVIDGKIPFPSAASGRLGFSPDGKHYLYVLEKGGRTSIVLDHKKLRGGGTFKFGPDNSVIRVTGPARGVQTLSVNGHALLHGYQIQIRSVHRSSAGLTVVPYFKQYNGSRALWANGHTVASDCGSLDAVVFSPDGKHYIAVCSSALGSKAFAVIDGHKGRTYQHIDNGTVVRDGPTFTADSSRAIYVGGLKQGGYHRFAVVNGKEFGPYGGFDAFATSAHGNGYAWAAYSLTDNGGGNPDRVVWNGQPVPLGDAQTIKTPIIGPNGKHLYFATYTRQSSVDYAVLFRDGKRVAGVKAAQAFRQIGTKGTRFFAMSPDGRTWSMSPTGGRTRCSCTWMGRCSTAVATVTS